MPIFIAAPPVLGCAGAGPDRTASIASAAMPDMRKNPRRARSNDGSSAIWLLGRQVRSHPDHPRQGRNLELTIA